MQKPPKSILCVEDNEDICFMLSTVLDRAGYAVTCVSNPAEALAAVGSQGFDLYILDARLGEENGIDLCRTLRAIHPGTPVVFYSAAVYDNDKHAALRAGACAYITKPGTDELVEAVRRALDAD